jgi:hypothetical protein
VRITVLLQRGVDAELAQFRVLLQLLHCQHGPQINLSNAVFASVRRVVQPEHPSSIQRCKVRETVRRSMPRYPAMLVIFQPSLCSRMIASRRSAASLIW